MIRKNTCILRTSPKMLHVILSVFNAVLDVNISLNNTAEVSVKSLLLMFNSIIVLFLTIDFNND